MAPASPAARTPSQGTTAAGGRQRSSPTGGAANGMPLNATMPGTADSVPWTRPPVTATGVSADSATADEPPWAAAGTAAAASSPAAANASVRTDGLARTHGRSLDRTGIGRPPLAIPLRIGSSSPPAACDGPRRIRAAMHPA